VKNSKTIPRVKFVLGKNVSIEKGVIIGYSRLSKLREGYSPKPVTIGDNTLIRTGSIIYAGCVIGKDCHIGHNVVLREFTEIGDNSTIGSGVVCEGYTHIGHNTIIHAQTHLTALMWIGDYVFIGPKVTTANDRFPHWYRPNLGEPKHNGPFISSEAIIGAGAILLPEIKIGQGSIIGAGSVVTKDVSSYELWIGTPARYYRDVRQEERVKI
jgi:acetyltransferase-like isoleucine patch superfamily enzyme